MPYPPEECFPPQLTLTFNRTEVNELENRYFLCQQIFSYLCVAKLGWSPNTRSQMRRKRKSDPIIDDIEDGARAMTTENAIQMIIYSSMYRKVNTDRQRVLANTLTIIKQMTEGFEVRHVSRNTWKQLILEACRHFNHAHTLNNFQISVDMKLKSFALLAL